MNSDGSNKTQITFNTHCYYGGPFFSKNGEEVLFRADKEKKDYLQIYTINLNNFEELQLTSNEYVNWSPYYHPSGKYIAYTTSMHGHDQYEIYLLELSSFKQTRLTFNPSFDGLPVFNWRGDKLLWTSKRAGKYSQLFIADFIAPTEP
jgi:Tol biopolymer transport system component